VKKDNNGKIAKPENAKNPKKTLAKSPKDSPSRSPQRIVTGLMPDSDQIRLGDIRGNLQDSRRQFEKKNQQLQEQLSNFSHGLNRSGSGSPFRPCCGNHISPVKEQHHEKSSPSPSKFVITNKRMDDSFGLDPLKISEGNQVAGCSMTDRINKDGDYMDTYLKSLNRSVDKHKDRSNKQPNRCRLDYRKYSLGAAARLESNEKKLHNKQKLNNSRQSLIHKRNKSVIALIKPLPIEKILRQHGQGLPKPVEENFASVESGFLSLTEKNSNFRRLTEKIHEKYNNDD
jgi:ABC-type phosphate transport system auxiliary subunit